MMLSPEGRETMEIYGPAHLHGPQNINPPHHHRVARPGAPSATRSPGDTLELSEAGRIAARLAEVSDIRHDRVAEIRKEIAAGTYETPEKLSTALDRLLDEIG
jgi:negative regulator of flagellin synthesis FlgM